MSSLIFGVANNSRRHGAGKLRATGGNQIFWLIYKKTTLSFQGRFNYLKLIKNNPDAGTSSCSSSPSSWLYGCWLVFWFGCSYW